MGRQEGVEIDKGFPVKISIIIFRVLQLGVVPQGLPVLFKLFAENLLAIAGFAQ